MLWRKHPSVFLPLRKINEAGPGGKIVEAMQEAPRLKDKTPLDGRRRRRCTRPLIYHPASDGKSRLESHTPPLEMSHYAEMML